MHLAAIWYNLLTVPAVNAGRVATHDELLHLVWGQANPAGVVRTLVSINQGPLWCLGGPSVVIAKPESTEAMRRWQWNKG